MSSERTDFQELCKAIGYQFKTYELIEQALRHPSYSHENPKVGDNNQRLEFLGDAVLGLVVAAILLQAYQEAREGQLTQWRAALVSEKPLAQVAKEIGLDKLIMLGRGEEATGGRNRPSLLSDGLEALIGATFLDGGIDAAFSVVSTILGHRIRNVCTKSPLDYKSKLQEVLQAKTTEIITYELVGTFGPDHDKRFEIHLKLGENIIGEGIGTSKKNAQQQAACNALEKLSEESNKTENTTNQQRNEND